MNEAEIRARLSGRLARATLSRGAHRLSAVLVPLEPGRGVWLTRRSADLFSHAGQVAFPGGTIDAADASIEAAALREAEEEIGLARDQAEVLGRIDDFITGTGFHISPVVALVPIDVHFVAATAEVQDIFCLPFEVLLDEQAPRRRQVTMRNDTREFWVWPHDEHLIWGATAAILRDLAERLRTEP